MEVRYLPNAEAYRRMTTDELRGAFVLHQLFVPGAATLVYCDTDRMIVGGIVPTSTPLKLLATKKEMAADYFAERREAGIVNLGGKGSVHVDGKEYVLGHKDMLYIGRGSKDVELRSAGADQPAIFYLASYPAHASYPTTLVRYADADKTSLGSSEAANKRTIFKYIHQGGAKSCQLVMGLTELEPGSVWNSMPPHTHQRRMEVYTYAGLDPDAFVVHLMGPHQETKSLIVRNLQAVISPSWSIHCGAGTRNYFFIWAMGGENQEFSDMDAVSLQDLS